MSHGGSRLPEGVREGEVVAGKYRIGAILGWGAMGTVVAAQHELLERTVAIKFLRPEAVDHLEARSRFFREAQAADRIDSKHVVRVFDVGTLASGEPYIVMERLQGCDLATWLRERGPLRPTQAIDFILQTCDVIGKAHARNIVHRDLKPANLFAVQHPDREPFIKVLDFGIAKNMALVSPTVSSGDPRPSSVVTLEHAFIGTPVYMSPEQLGSSRDVDGRTDIWALGVILFELVAGRLPFEGNLLEVCAKVAAPLPLPRTSPPLPPPLEAIISRCLERARERRFASAGDLARALGDCGRELQSGGAVARVSAPPLSQPMRSLKSRATAVSPKGFLLAAILGTGATALAIGSHAAKTAHDAGEEEIPESRQRFVLLPPPRVPTELPSTRSDGVELPAAVANDSGERATAAGSNSARRTVLVRASGGPPLPAPKPRTPTSPTELPEATRKPAPAPLASGDQPGPDADAGVPPSSSDTTWPPPTPR